MYKQLLLILSTAFFTHAALANTCPSVADIKQNRITGWVAYDSDDGTPFPATRMKQLRDSIEQFALAEFKAKGPNGNSAIHCYYRDKHGSDLEAYYAKENIKPDDKSHVWYKVTGSLHCAAGMDKCAFKDTLPSANALAKK